MMRITHGPSALTVACEYLLWIGAGFVAFPIIVAIELADALQALVPRRRRQW
jgi:hypothetical protein